MGAAPGTDIVLTEERMVSARAFANKIWNAARFLFLNMERAGVEPWVPDDLETLLAGGDGRARRRRPLDLQPPERTAPNRSTAPSSSTATTKRRRCSGTSSGTSSATGTWSSRSCASAKTPGLNADWRNVLAAFRDGAAAAAPGDAVPHRGAVAAAGRGRAEPARVDRAGRLPAAAAGADRRRGRARDRHRCRRSSPLARNLRAEMKLDPKQQLEGVLYSRGAALDVGARARRGHPEAGQREAGVRSRSGAARRRPPSAPPPSSTWCWSCRRRRWKRSASAWKRRASSSRRVSPTPSASLSDETFLSRAPAARGGDHPRRSWPSTRRSCARAARALDGLAES